MKLKPLTALIIICASALFSCKKSSNSNTQNNPNKLKLYIEDASQTPLGIIDTFTVSYDADSRITALTSLSEKFVYTYSNSSFTLDLYQNNALSIHEILFLNNQSYIDSTFQYDNTSDSTTEKYNYNGKLLSRLTSYIYSSSGSQIDTQDDYVYDNNGNLTTDTQTDGFGDVNTISTFTYTGKILNFSIQPFYFPVKSENLPATQVQTDGVGDTLASVTYAYTFDSQGRVIAETDTDSVSGYTLVKRYVYD
jgi:YD repeat-containing protein